MGLVDHGLLTKNVRKTGNASGADCGSTDETTPVRKWSDRLLDLVEVGITTEGPVTLADSAIDANIELILVVGVIRGAGVVIGSSTICRGWEAGKKSLRCGIKGSVDHVPRKLLPNVLTIDDSRASRIIDLGDTCEDSLSLIKRRNSRDEGAANELFYALIVPEEEETIMQYGSAESGTIQVATILRFAASGSEVVARIQIFVAEELKEAAVYGV
jgi:hypothetical protein